MSTYVDAARLELSERIDSLSQRCSEAASSRAEQRDTETWVERLEACLRDLEVLKADVNRPIPLRSAMSELRDDVEELRQVCREALEQSKGVEWRAASVQEVRTLKEPSKPSLPSHDEALSTQLLAERVASCSHQPGQAAGLAAANASIAPAPKEFPADVGACPRGEGGDDMLHALQILDDGLSEQSLQEEEEQARQRTANELAGETVDSAHGAGQPVSTACPTEHHDPDGRRPLGRGARGEAEEGLCRARAPGPW